MMTDQPLKLRALLWLALLLFFAGCGGSTVETASIGNNETAPTATATVRMQTVLAQQTVPSEVDAFRAFGYNSQGSLVYGPETVSKQSPVDFENVPVTVTNFVVEFLRGEQVVLLAQFPLSLSAGETFLVENPELFGFSEIPNGLFLSPSDLTLAVGTSGEFAATGTVPGSGSRSFTEQVVWSSSNPAVATVQNGEVRALQVGQTTITATFGSLSTSAEVTVTSAMVLSLSVAPENPVLAVGTDTSLTVTGLFSDQTEQVLTDATFQSSNEAVAVVSSNGTVTAEGPGQTVVTSSFSSVSSSVTVTVTEAALTGIDLSLAQSSIAAGTSTTFQVIGTFSDASTQDLTSSSAVTFSLSGLVSVVTPGVLKGETTGTSGVQVAFGGFQDSGSITVTEAVLTAIELRSAETDESTAVELSEKIELQVIGTFSDNSEQNITDNISFSVSPSDSVAFGTVSSGDPTVEVTGNTVGSALVTATSTSDSSFASELSLTVTEPPIPDLIFSTSGTFDTDTGELNGAMVDGWDDSDLRVEVGSFTVNSGVVVTLQGTNPFVVHANRMEMNGEITGATNSVDMELFSFESNGTAFTMDGDLTGNSSSVKVVSNGAMQFGSAEFETRNADVMVEAQAEITGTSVNLVATRTGIQSTLARLKSGGDLTIVNSLSLQASGANSRSGPSTAASGGRAVIDVAGDADIDSLYVAVNGGAGIFNSLGDGGDAGSIELLVGGALTLGEVIAEAFGGEGGSATTSGKDGGNGGELFFSAQTAEIVGFIEVHGGDGDNAAISGNGGNGGNGGRAVFLMTTTSSLSVNVYGGDGAPGILDGAGGDGGTAVFPPGGTADVSGGSGSPAGANGTIVN